MDEKGLDRVGDPDDRIKPFPFDGLPVGVGDEGAVARPAASTPRTPSPGAKATRSRGAGEDRPAERLGLDERPGDERLVVAGQEPRRGGDAERPEPGFEEAPRSVRRPRVRRERRPRRFDQAVRGSLGGAGARPPVDQLAGRAPEAAERVQMVVVAEALEIIEAEPGRGAARPPSRLSVPPGSPPRASSDRASGCRGRRSRGRGGRPPRSESHRRRRPRCRG